MISSDAEILKLKNVIKEEVCKLAWADNLTQEAVDEMILRMFPGPKPNWRCCVYKEREIVRERVKLAVEKGGQGLSEEERETFYHALEVISSNLKAISKDGL